jgi:quercetin dioxygenase-like cupin family protein
MQRWNLREIATPDGSRSPVILHSEEGVARAVLIELEPGQELGDHEVKERAFVAVVDGSVRVEADTESFEAGVGTLLRFDPEERHAIASASGARILMLLAPWPGAGHFRGDASR